MDEEEKYTATPAEMALYTVLVTGRVALAILQAYVDGKMDEETYRQLYEVANQADRAARKLEQALEKMEEQEG
jgi:ribosomal protein L19E